MNKLRIILNPLILNEGWVRFNGDSMYFDKDGEVIMGNWTFLDMFGPDEFHTKCNFTLDDEIDESKLHGKSLWAIENDNGKICIVEFTYGDKNCDI